MNKAFLSFAVIGTLLCSVNTIPVRVSAADMSVTPYDDEVQPRTEGLIYRYDLSVSAGNNAILITGNTRSNETMKSIGLKNITIQRSSNGTSWTDEKEIDDLLASSAKSKYVSAHSVSVQGGYYYRVVCTHYAKESGLFGSSQSISNTSNSVWIS